VLANKPLNNKILHIELAKGGGVEVYVRMLLNHTSQQYQSALICPQIFNKNALTNFNGTIYEIDSKREISLFADLATVLKIRRIIKKENPDILYCHSSKAGALGRVAALGKKCKIIYNAHGWSFGMNTSKLKKSIYIFTERLLAKMTDKIITISEFEKALALKNKVGNANKLQAILNGIDLTQSKKPTTLTRQELNIPPDALVVGCVARISAQKDPLLFAKAARLVKQAIPNTFFLWVGDGELKEEFAQTLKDCNVDGSTIITGWVDNTHEYIELFDIAVLFSQWEGFGLVLAEYMAHCKPIVAHKTDAIPEIITHQRNGILIEDITPQKAANAIIDIYNLENKEEIRANNLTDAEQFDVARVARQTEDIYKALTEKGMIRK
jgi:glycosyltransferase involved in cell wall biosynthesis